MKHPHQHYVCKFCGAELLTSAVDVSPVMVADDKGFFACAQTTHCRERVYQRLQALQKKQADSKAVVRIILYGNAYGGVWFWQEGADMIRIGSQSAQTVVQGRFIPDDTDVL